MAEMTVAQHIFETPYETKIANIYCYTEEYLKVMPIATTGDRETDKVLMRQKRHMYMTIADMVTFFKEGADVELTNPRDAIIIYKTLRQHLENWKLVVDTVLNAPPPPVEDLLLMDAFAEQVYRIASRYDTNLAPIGELESRLANSLGRRVGRRVQAPTDVPKGESATPVTTHTPIADKIARTTFGRRQR